MWQFIARFWLFLGSNGDIVLAIFKNIFDFLAVFDIFWLFLTIYSWSLATTAGKFFFVKIEREQIVLTIPFIIEAIIDFSSIAHLVRKDF